MGQLWTKLFGDKVVKILMLGLDGVGKTTMLYKLKLGEIVTTIPTIGFNIETLEAKGVKLIMWDVGSRSGIRPLRRHYYPGMNGLILMVDSSDVERIMEVREELSATLVEDELRGVPLVVVANKQDLGNALSHMVIAQRLGLWQIRDRAWDIFAASAVNNEGIREALEWLAETIASQCAGVDVNAFQGVNIKEKKDDQVRASTGTPGTKPSYGWQSIVCAPRVLVNLIFR